MDQSISIGTDKPKRKRHVPQFNEAMQTIFALMPLISLGLFLVLFGALALLWPTGAFGEEQVQTINNFERIAGSIQGQYPSSIAKIVLDIAYYFIVIAASWFVVRAWIGAKRLVFVYILAVSILGLSYLAGMVLYSGPMVSSCGFTMLLFGSLVALTVARDHYDSDDTNESSDQNGTESNSPAKIDLTQKESAQSYLPDSQDKPADQTQSIEVGTDENA